ncbi:hypothetical protein SK128_011601 [Halocaridina rubra]|uniref:DAGKc domain-containing protein n=1 Tax=Halocaridina rubra TaxID=373956 RepID=A0AAN8WPU7_HALRR
MPVFEYFPNVSSDSSSKKRNQKSGSSECSSILSSFRRILNPAQVMDLAEHPPEEALEWCDLVPSDVTCRIIVAGGDGTVGWVFDAIFKLKLKYTGIAIEEFFLVHNKGQKVSS